MAGIVILFILSAFYSKQAASIGFEGDSCTLDSGAPGTCAILEQCPYAVLLLKANKKPINCGFRRYMPIVCCPNDQQPEKLTLLPGNITKEVCRKFYPPPSFANAAYGGVKSLAGEFPHMAILGYSDEANMQWLCGGSLISEQFVLTAAHCMFSQSFGKVQRVRLGDLDIKNTTDYARPQDFNILETFIHPDYKTSAQYNDIALIKLDREATFDEYVKPACLQTDHAIEGLNRLQATGWGKTDFAGEPSSHMLKVDLSYVNNTACSKYYENVSNRKKLERGIDDTTQICAGDSEGKDTCPGDSGGPLQFYSFADETTFIHWRIIGVTSFGKACGIAKDSCGVYTRVSHYVPWIEKIVWPNFTV